MQKIEQRYLIKASIEKVWDALVNPKTIEKWGAGPAVMKGEVGFDFSLWGGDIYGKNLEVINPDKGEKKLLQEWYGGDWEVPSIATIKLNSDGEKTEVILEHKDLPENEIDEFANGWKEYYFGAIKKHLEV